LRFENVWFGFSGNSINPCHPLFDLRSKKTARDREGLGETMREIGKIRGERKAGEEKDKGKEDQKGT